LRRLVVETPIRMATAARHVATFALYVVVISVLLLRFDIVDVKGGLAALASGWALALLAAIMALVAFATIWRTGAAGGARAFFAFALASALLTPAVYFGLRALQSPLVSDITTDLEDPPRFTVAGSERSKGANPVAYDPANAPIQLRFYPTVHPPVTDVPPEDMRKLILELIRERRWRLVADTPLTIPDSPGRVPVRSPVGRVEAVAHTLILGLEDDIAIRLREDGGRTRVDMRSASRVGRIDFGVNARRVMDFLEELRTRALIPVQATQ
jgi:hypothetical protein